MTRRPSWSHAAVATVGAGLLAFGAAALAAGPGASASTPSQITPTQVTIVGATTTTTAHPTTTTTTPAPGGTPSTTATTATTSPGPAVAPAPSTTTTTAAKGSPRVGTSIVTPPVLPTGASVTGAPSQDVLAPQLAGTGPGGANQPGPAPSQRASGVPALRNRVTRDGPPLVLCLLGALVVAGLGGLEVRMLGRTPKAATLPATDRPGTPPPATRPGS